MVNLSKKDVQRELKLPKEYSGKLAEFLGILTGDGYMNHYRDYDYVVEISGNKLLDLDYIEQHVFSLVKDLFNVTGCIIKRTDQNTIYLRIRSKGLFFYLKEIGFKKGYKNRIGIPRWVQNNREFLILFTRGLFDTDGTLSLKNRNKKIYPVVSIVSKSDLLLKKVQHFIKINGISSHLAKDVMTGNRYKKPVTVFRLQVNGYKNCGHWLSLIGSNNHRNLMKFKKVNINIGAEKV
jgi:intein/homing endonuclease